MTTVLISTASPFYMAQIWEITGTEKCGLYPGILLEKGGRGQGLGQTTRARKVISGPGDFGVPEKKEI